MTLLEQRDAILESLRAQFWAKVIAIQLAPLGSLSGLTASVDHPVVDAFLRDLANNIAQGLDHD